jgi:hypothetical protein
VGSNPTPAADRTKSRTVEPKAAGRDIDPISPLASADIHRDAAGLALTLALEGCVCAGNSPLRVPAATSTELPPAAGLPVTRYRRKTESALEYIVEACTDPDGLLANG